MFPCRAACRASKAKRGMADDDIVVILRKPDKLLLHPRVNKRLPAATQKAMDITTDEINRRPLDSAGFMRQLIHHFLSFRGQILDADDVVLPFSFPDLIALKRGVAVQPFGDRRAGNPEMLRDSRLMPPILLKNLPKFLLRRHAGGGDPSGEEDVPTLFL